MMYPYITLSDETEITHSQIIEDGDVQKSRNILSAPQSTVLTPHDVFYLRINGNLMRGSQMLR